MYYILYSKKNYSSSHGRDKKIFLLYELCIEDISRTVDFKQYMYV
jgi:hypothetical protein